MKFFAFLTVALIIIGSFPACKKDSFISSSNAYLHISDDTLHFDTVFTTTGSTTQFFKIFNDNDQKLLLSNVQLMGGAASFFKLNVDGSAGTDFSNIELAANDSLYGFVTVSINPNATNLPFVVRDSIQISFNGNTRYLQLEAYGQNAFFLRNAVITKDTAWTNNLPIVILGSLTVNKGKTLTINKGSKIYVHANAPIQINGSLKALGDSNARIQFTGDRLDDPYKDYPGSWPGIYFQDSSSDNLLQFCIIKNAYQGAMVQKPILNGAASPKLTINESIFDNIYDIAIGGTNTSITARNCLVSNSGYNLSINSGGNYSFTNCTIASYGNTYVDHKNPVLILSNTNTDNSTANPLYCTFTNSILYGSGGLVDNELAFNKSSNTAVPFVVSLNNVLYKQKKAIDPTNATINTTSIANQAPLFDSINVGNKYYSFRLKPTSPCYGAGSNTVSIPYDLDGVPATVPFNIGCYQNK